mmetsp:Transcript_33848/g.34114  ORF Transcript_33848/g.34114 Transcript_33848/m.34114 type:complete len:83 (-) Transcript_33848:701-949(-)
MCYQAGGATPPQWRRHKERGGMPSECSYDFGREEAFGQTGIYFVRGDKRCRKKKSEGYRKNVRALIVSRPTKIGNEYSEIMQ